MPKFTTDSKFLSHSDLSDVEDSVVTIKSIDRELVGQGAQASERWIVYFREFTKGLALNSTNGKMLCQLLRTEEMDHWIGQRIALYVRKDVEFQGKTVSAIRVRNKSYPATASPMNSITPEEVMAQLLDATSAVEIFTIKRTIDGMHATDTERMQLNSFADSRMAELRTGRKS